MNRDKSIKTTMVVLFVALCYLFAAGASAQQNSPGTQASIGAESKPITKLQEKMKKVVSVDFRETPIEDVVRMFAEEADIDIIKSPDVKGTVTAKLTAVPLDEAMESILAVHGYAYVTTGSIVRIVPQVQLGQPLVTRIYHLDYAKMEDVIQAVKDVLSPNGKVASNRETNHIVITENKDHLSAVEQFIAEMDREVPQILVEARIYDMSCEDSLDLGFEWFAGRRTTYDSDGLVTGGEKDPFIRGAFSSTISQASKTNAGLRFGVLDEAVDIDTAIRAAQDKIKTRLLANPKILVIDNRQATIKIVREIPYQELTQTSGGGNMGTTKFKEVGVALEVTPHITRDGKIMLKLNPTFSVETGDFAPMTMPSGLGGAITSSVPIVNKREATTETLITNGQTVVIGGLRERNVVQQISKVPLLGDLPLLKALFSYKGEKIVNSELVVFITPYIVSDASVLSGREAKRLIESEKELREPEAPSTTLDSREDESD